MEKLAFSNSISKKSVILACMNIVIGNRKISFRFFMIMVRINQWEMKMQNLHIFETHFLLTDALHKFDQNTILIYYE